MLTHLRPALVMIILFTVLTGLIYPLAMTGLLQLAMPGAANGSLIERGGTVVGSSLIGQTFTDDKYFHARPSAAGDGYNAAASSGSNLGPLSAKLLDRVKADVEKLKPFAGNRPVPADAVTASASGLDSDISPSNASTQVKRIATARGVPEQRISDILARHIAGAVAGVFGEPRVNVLELNLALDAELAARSG